MSLPEYYEVAVPSPLRRLFHYLPPPGHGHRIAPGSRVRVPFGSRRMVGLVTRAGSGDIPGERTLRAIDQVVDDEPLVPAELLALACWAADYYQHPPGEALASILPSLLKRGDPCPEARAWQWQLSVRGRGLPADAFPRAPRRRQLVELLRDAPQAAAALQAAGISMAIVRALEERGLIERRLIRADFTARGPLLAERPPEPHADQQQALAALELDRYQTYLLYGDTGTGKTEIYLRAIERVLRLGRQALVLVPEIALTPQTLARFEARFGCPVAVLHSGLGEVERARTWMAARDGAIGVLIGTRSAAFAPLRAPGIIIVDEEHDLSYKQQDGFRYSARDVAVVRARSAGIPLLLGSATPSLESLHNAARGRYRTLRLTQRTGAASAPRWELIDLRRAGLREGLSAPALEAISDTLAAGRQALVFLNRRGYATALLCHDCAWIGGCPHCETRLTVHLAAARMICHHCGHHRPLPARCPDCGSGHLQQLGQGTERAESTLRELFPQAPVLRIDRDSTRGRRSLEAKLARINSGGPGILVGTQMLAKGHHFPDLDLAVILNADDGLMSPDFRGSERLGQLLTQVAGRAGRGDRPGRVLVQSHYCDHPLLRVLVESGYGAFAERLLHERAAAGMPPHSALALLRAEARVAPQAEALLVRARRIGESLSTRVRFLGPLPAPLEKRGGRYRFLLSLGCSHRGPLQELLATLATRLESLPEARQVRWSLDADPQEML